MLLFAACSDSTYVAGDAMIKIHYIKYTPGFLVRFLLFVIFLFLAGSCDLLILIFRVYFIGITEIIFLNNWDPICKSKIGLC